MELKCIINGQAVAAEARADMTLLDFLRARGYKSVKCGCETTNCGLCTVWLDGKPVLSCAVPAMRVQGREVTTLEGLKEEAEEMGLHTQSSTATAPVSLSDGKTMFWLTNSEVDLSLKDILIVRRITWIGTVVYPISLFRILNNDENLWCLLLNKQLHHRMIPT